MPLETSRRVLDGFFHSSDYERAEEIIDIYAVVSFLENGTKPENVSIENGKT